MQAIVPKMENQASSKRTLQVRYIITAVAAKRRWFVKITAAVSIGASGAVNGQG